MDTQLDLETAISAFAHRDEYKYILWVIRQEREGLFADLQKVKDPYEVMKIAGRIACADQILDLLSPPD